MSLSDIFWPEAADYIGFLSDPQKRYLWRLFRAPSPALFAVKIKRPKRRNPNARTLADPQFHQRIVSDKRKESSSTACRKDATDKAVNAMITT